MKVLLTGANGFLGSYIGESLVGAGTEPRFLLRPTSYLAFIEGLGYERAEGDMRDAGSLAAAVAGVDTVIHAAALTSARDAAEFRAVNEEGTRLLVAAAVRAGVRRFVYVSSLAAQGPSPDGRCEDPASVIPHPMSTYGRSKLAGEEAVVGAREGMNVAIVRPPVIYGPRDRALLPFYRLVNLRLMVLYGDGSNRISWVFARDAAEAIVQVALASAASGATYTISDGATHTWSSLTDLLAAALGRRPLRLPIPPGVFAAAGHVGGALNQILPGRIPLDRQKVREMAQPFWICGNERITAETGWGPTVQAVDGIRDTLRWYRAHGWL